jgi:16S rRNA (adenine1518-N6/adenine1519-N6)-dimethyltransferase
MPNRISPQGRPKKSLGQHFLQDENVARRIADALKSENIRQVFEIGAGTGVLTRYLFERTNIHLTAVEIDLENVHVLREEFPQYRDQILHQDALRYPLTSQTGEHIAVIGNFPYNISSQLFFRILEYRNDVQEVVCMIQKEVAERIAAPPGSKTYGILSVLLQSYYNIEYLFTVSPNVFYPKPKVHSAVIRLTRNSTGRLACDEVLFFRVVKTCFNHRRKIIRNTVKSIVGEITKEYNLLYKRPEQLSTDQFVELTRWVQDQV